MSFSGSVMNRYNIVELRPIGTRRSARWEPIYRSISTGALTAVSPYEEHPFLSGVQSSLVTQQRWRAHEYESSPVARNKVRPVPVI